MTRTHNVIGPQAHWIKIGDPIDRHWCTNFRPFCAHSNCKAGMACSIKATPESFHHQMPFQDLVKMIEGRVSKCLTNFGILRVKLFYEWITLYSPSSLMFMRCMARANSSLSSIPSLELSSMIALELQIEKIQGVFYSNWYWYLQKVSAGITKFSHLEHF